MTTPTEPTPADAVVEIAAEAVDQLLGTVTRSVSTWVGPDEIARTALAAAVPLVLDEAARRIEAGGRRNVEFFAGDETKVGIGRLIGAEDAYKDVLAIVRALRDEWSSDD